MMRDYLYALLARYIGFFIPAGSRVLEVGPRSRRLADALSGREVRAYDAMPDAGFGPGECLADPMAVRAFAPEAVILNGVLQTDRDILSRLEAIHALCEPQTRVLITYYSSLWKPLLQLASALGIRSRMPEANWVAPADVANFLTLARFELVTSQPRVLVPIRIPLLSEWVNRWLAPLPVFRLLSLVHVVVARAIVATPSGTPAPSVSVVIPARNEAGNIAAAVDRLPPMGPADEIIFVEGHSTDGTWAEIEAVAQRRPDRRITCLRQPGTGKGDAVRVGFAAARNEILMILDADLTVPPEDLPKFYRARVSGVCEFVNGSRLVYPMETGAMRFLNMIGNKFFAAAFSFMLGQSFKDTLCGTKVIDRAAYARLAANRAYFGDFDPFGDFDLLFGAQRLGLRIVELPVRYRERTYGTTQIQRWRHGWLLLRMTLFAARRLKFI